MNNRIKSVAAVICMLMVMISLAACGSAGSFNETIENAKEKAEELKDQAEQKYNEIAGNLVDMDTESLDIQAGYFSDDGMYNVVVKNNSEDKILSLFSVSFDGYDSEGNLLESEVQQKVSLGPVFPGESAVARTWGDDSWVEKPSNIGYTINAATWGGSAKHVAITDTSYNYYGNYTVTISNMGKDDVDLQTDDDKWRFEIYAIFRDSEGTVTGVSPAFLEEFLITGEDGTLYGNYPVVPAGSEITTNAEVYDMHSGTAEIVIVWRAATH